ncbi:MAG: DUF3172 domain-containing protein [Cyanobacteria bacterium P01_F01_bin.42]
MGPPSNRGGGLGGGLFNNLSGTILAIIGGVFILGIALGVGLGSNTNFRADNVASTLAIDQSVPNADFCQSYGASATVMDTRVFLTFKPFSVFVSQPVMQPGCVMRQNNMAILEQKKLIDGKNLRECRQRYNTFGFTGRLEAKPAVTCIYQTDSDKNLFLNDDLGLPTEADNF